jgi:hypothetical protein
MPLSPGPSVPMDMPPDLAAAATASDDMIGGELGALIPPPEKPYNPRVMTSLAKAIAEVMSAMGVEMTPEPYTGPVAQFGEDEARFLTMIEAAAADYGQPLPVGVAELKGDAELTTLTAALSQLAQDAEFIAFLDEGAEPEPMAEEEVAVDEMEDEMDEEEPMEEEPAPKGKPAKGKSGGDDDFFAKRMR